MTRDRFGMLLLTGFGLGTLRPAPGTWGSLAPVLMVVGAVTLASRASISQHHLVINGLLVAMIVVFSWVCVMFGGIAETRFGRKDPQLVVADEIAGQSLTLLALPWRFDHASGAALWNVSIAILAFLSFRAADILKPPPAGSLQRLPRGWGILIDDLVAAAYAAIATQLLVRLVL